MHFTLCNHLLVVDTPADQTGKLLTKSLGGTTRTLPNQLPVVVWWKRSFHIKPWQEVGDGMAVVSLYDREPLQFPLDIIACVHGVLAYAVFDEEHNRFHHYLYKSSHTSEELTWIAQWLAKNYPALTVHKERFVELRLAPDTTLSPFVGETPAQLLSWLFGLSVGYGTWQVRDDRLVRILLTIPQVGSLTAVALACEEGKMMLHDLGIVLDLQTLSGKLNDTLQISLQDPEMVTLFGQWYTDEISSYTSPYTAALEDFLMQSGSDKVSAQFLAHSVLKMREK